MPETRNPLGTAPRVPAWEAIANDGARRLNGLWREVVKLVKDRDNYREAELLAIFEEMELIRVQIRMAGLVLGLMSPWKQPAIPRRLALANTLFGFRFPWLERAWEFLVGKRVVSASDFTALERDEKQSVFAAPGIESKKVLREIQKGIATSLETGESLANYRKGAGHSVDLSRSQTETLFRTETKRAYVEGQATSSRNKIVRREFPAFLYSSTPDTRVRDSHWDLDGFVCLTTDRAYRVLQRALRDYNCRCSGILITLEDAEELYGGLRTYSDLPASVKAEYG